MYRNRDRQTVTVTYQQHPFTIDASSSRIDIYADYCSVSQCVGVRHIDLKGVFMALDKSLRPL